MFDIEIAENIFRLKKKYYYNLEFCEKLSALSYLIKKGIIPEELMVLYNNDIGIMEYNLLHLA